MLFQRALRYNKESFEVRSLFVGVPLLMEEGGYYIEVNEWGLNGLVARGVERSGTHVESKYVCMVIFHYALTYLWSTLFYPTETEDPVLPKAS